MLASPRRIGSTAMSFDQLNGHWAEIRRLTAVQELLGWDQETQIPSAAHSARAAQLSTIAGIKHERLTSDRLWTLIEECSASTDSSTDSETGSLQSAQLARARHTVERARRIPARLARELASTSGDAVAVWQEARAKNDYSLFARHLERLLELKREEASALLDDSRHGCLYDSLLDEYEPGFRCADLDPLFDQLEIRLRNLVRDAGESGIEVDESIAKGDFRDGDQRNFGRWAAEAIGFDFSRGRLDRSTHPFCVGLHPDDVRLTWRPDPADFRPALFGVLHEVGHGLYEQGLPRDLVGTPVGEAASMGAHESQSRLWENHVGRSLGFWRFALPQLTRIFPGTEIRTAEQLWPSLHSVRPSLIRVDADETSYNLHILIRYKLERSLIDGDVEVAELPTVWNQEYRRLLGVLPANDSEGVLQDVHWSMGLFGYFPTYTIGTLMSSQLWRAACSELGDIETEFESGTFAALLDWLRTRVHCHGARFATGELVRRATGEELGSSAFLDYLDSNVREIYGRR